MPTADPAFSQPPPAEPLVADPRPHRVVAPAPSPSPLATLAARAGCAELGVPGLGTVRATREHVEVGAPNHEAQDATWAALGTWAQAQHLQARGYFVACGAVVAIGDRIIALTGPSRAGASITAMIFALQGATVVADGLVVLDNRGHALPRGGVITLDDHALPSDVDVPSVALPTGRPRRAVSMTPHAGGLVTDWVRLRETQSVDRVRVLRMDGTVADTEPDAEAASGEITAFLADESVSWPAHQATRWNVRRPTQPEFGPRRSGLPLDVVRELRAALGLAGA